MEANIASERHRDAGVGGTGRSQRAVRRRRRGSEKRREWRGGEERSFQVSRRRDGTPLCMASARRRLMLRLRRELIYFIN
jgi:hypothetical protein